MCIVDGMCLFISILDRQSAVGWSEDPSANMMDAADYYISIEVIIGNYRNIIIASIAM